MEEMARHQTTHNNSDIAVIIKNIRHMEEVKNLFHLMKPIAKGEVGGTVSCIKEPIPMESPAIYLETLFTLGFKSKYRE
eukprot:5467008-Ditylum_brightwellii.AAC.1